MHSHDRTLAARLGFSDPDKKIARHDLACEYLLDAAPIAFGSKADKCRARLEVPISKGHGQYKTTIGFLDVSGVFASANEASLFAIEVKIAPCSVGDILRQISLYNEYPWYEGLADEASRLSDYQVSQLDVQFRWGVVADFDMDTRALARHGVQFARLGPTFDEWLKTRTTESIGVVL